MSVTSSRLRHQGVPGLQAQKWVSTENTRASTIVIGTTLVIVWPNISTTSKGRLDITTSLIGNLRVTCPCLRRGECRNGRVCANPILEVIKAMSHFAQGFNSKFTLLKNSIIQRYLRNRINCTAILQP